MSIRVEHREDKLLQESTEEKVTEGLKGTYVERVTMPHHRTLLLFLDEVIVGKEFADEAALQEALGTWSDFAKQRGLEVDADWQPISIKETYIVLAAANSLGGPFVLGVIKELAQ